MDGEPGSAVLAIFDQLIDRIKQMSPKRSDGAPLQTRVYSQLTLGMPIVKEDYDKPWTPIGGASLATTFPAGQPGTLPGAGPQAGPAPEDVTAAVLRSLQAAWKTSLLAQTMLRVVKDDRYEEYPTGRHLDFAYESILEGMTATATFTQSPEIQERVKQAEALLFSTDADGFNVMKPAYERYIKNVRAEATARAAHDAAFRDAQRDPVKLAAWPMTSLPLIDEITIAHDRVVAEGGPRIEAALDTLSAIGRPVQEFMISKAKDEWKAWNLGLAGVPSKVPFSMVLPSTWADPDKHDGFQTLEVSQSEYASFSGASDFSQSQGSWRSHAEQSSGGGGFSLGFMAFGGSGSASSSESSWQNSNSARRSNSFSNSAKNLRISIEYALCDIIRPWLISDLFFMKGWHLEEARRASISDGTIDGQADSQDKLLPMIPRQMLVVRNVTIHTDDWGSDFSSFDERYGASGGSAMQDQSEFGAAGGVCLGFINLGGTASHAEQNAATESSAWQAGGSSSYMGTRFSDNTLTIPGAQVVAFLCDIVPLSPEIDDPDLPPEQ